MFAPMANLPAKQEARRELTDLPFWWERSSAPELPFSLPISVRLNVAADALRIHAIRESTFAEVDDVDATLVFEKPDILSVEVFLMPDVPDDAESPWIENDLSLVVVRHRDPCGVEAYFESLFSSRKAYWPKALAKLLRERAAIEAKVTEENQTSRKLRLTRETLGSS